MQFKTWNLYLCTVSYLQINKCSNRHLICCLFVSYILLLVSLVRASSSNQSTYLGFICNHIFFSFGIYPDGTFHHARQRQLPYFPGKCTSGIAGNGISMALCTARHGMRKVASPQFLRSFLIFYFPKLLLAF